jgi:WD40 repeat protein
MIQESIEKIEQIETRSNPFPGLRPFELHESHLFFGRDGQSEQLIAKLNRARFLAVVGTSGSGKSSLVRAGLLPSLLAGFMTSAGSNWRMAIMRPGADPLGNLARALNEPEVFGSEDVENRAIQTEMIKATLRRSSLGLIDAARLNGMPQTENLLVLADQFEEIFRFAQTEKDTRYENEAAAFVKLLLEAARQRDMNIYVVLTMRSDYLGDCAQFQDLPEAINEGQYLIPRLTRDQRREAIEFPVAIAGAEITPRLVNRLLNDVGDNPDQLPILQHALMRAWDGWKDKRPEHRAVHSGAAIDLCCYRTIGEMNEALSLHADEAYNELSEPRRKLAEPIFKCLTEKGADNREIRRPLTLAELQAVIEVDQSDIIAVIETFRRPGRSFLTPPAGTELRGESLIDISHESLIRNWKRLKEWVEDEADSAATYRRMAETAVLFNKREAGLWRDPDLQIALKWRERVGPNEAWARRYHPEFETAMAFLEASKKRKDEDIAERERQQKEKLEQAQALAREQELRIVEQTRATSRLRRFLAALIVVSLLALAAAGSAMAAYTRAEKEKRRAEENQRIADTEREKAEAQSGRADQAARDAIRQSEQAELEKQRAEENQRRAERLQIIAEREERSNRHLLYAANMNLAYQVYGDENTAAGQDIGRAQELLDLYLPTSSRSQREDLRGFDWYYLWRKSHFELATLPYFYPWFVSAVAFSPDGKILATGTMSQVILVDAHTQKTLMALDGGEHVLFSPSGDTLVIAKEEEGKVILRSLRDEKTVTISTEGSIIEVALSPDGKTIATGGKDKLVKLWNVDTQRMISTLGEHKEPVYAITFSRDGKTLATGSGDKTVRLWDTTTWKLRETHNLSSFSSYIYSISTMAFSADGRRLAVGYSNGDVEIWNAANPGGMSSGIRHPDGVTCLAFSPDGKMLASGGGRIVKVWDISSSNFSVRGELATFKGHNSFPMPNYNGSTDSVISLAFSPDNKVLASGSEDRTVKLWDTSNLKTDRLRQISLPPGGPLAFSPDGKTITAGDRMGVIRAKLWNSHSLDEMEAPKEWGSLSWVVFSPDGKTIVTGDDRTAQLWDAKTRKNLATIEKEDFLAFSPDSRLIVCVGRDYEMKLRDARTGQLVNKFERKSEGLIEAAFSPDAKVIAALNTKWEVELWDTRTNRLFNKLKESEWGVDSIAFSPNGKILATGNNDSSIKFWDTSTWRVSATMKGHRGNIPALVFSPDGGTLATGSGDKTVKLWSVSARRELMTLSHFYPVQAVAFSPDGRTLVSRDSTVVRVWTAATDKEVNASRPKK